jgi:drug/metabolite transporter (DMT)-like permease
MKRSIWLTFGALCLLSSSAWIAEPFATSTLPSLQRQALLYLIVGLAALLFSIKKLSSRISQQPWPRLAIASLGFFGIPAAAIEFASGSVPQISRSALFALVPIVVVVAVTAIEAGEPAERAARRSLTPALVGLTGLLLLLPLSFSNSARSDARIAVICAAVIMVGIASVWLYRLLQQFKLSDAIAVVCLPNAAFLLICAQASGTVVWNRSSLLSLLSWSSLVDVIEVLLLLWLLRGMPPVQFAARYLFIPLLTVVEGYILLRPELTLRIGVGTILLTTGVATLLLQHPAEEEPVLSLR